LNARIFRIALAMAMMSENSMHDNDEKPREFIQEKKRA
jgi:hypothetical protein